MSRTFLNFSLETTKIMIQPRARYRRCFLKKTRLPSPREEL